MHTEVFLDGLLLGSGQVVVNDVLAREAVFGDGAAPCFRRTTVAEVEVCDGQVVERLMQQAGVVLQVGFTGAALILVAHPLKQVYQRLLVAVFCELVSAHIVSIALLS